jgi:hypothetical protein
MFCTFNRSTLTARRIALVAAPLAVLGAAASTAAAADGHWGYRSHGPTLVIQAQIPAPVVIVEHRVVCDEVPAGLQMSAYQSKDRVIVVINGTNRGAGFHTSLSAFGNSFVLHNLAPEPGCRDGACSFTITGSICAGRDVRQVCVRIGERTFEVPVTCVPSLG